MPPRQSINGFAANWTEAVREWRRKVEAGETAVAAAEEQVEKGRQKDGKWVYRRIRAARRTARMIAKEKGQA